MKLVEVGRATVSKTLIYVRFFGRAKEKSNARNYLKRILEDKEVMQRGRMKEEDQRRSYHTGTSASRGVFTKHVHWTNTKSQKS